KAKNVVGIAIFFYPFHRLNAPVMSVAAPHDASVGPTLSQELRHVLDDGPHLRALRGACRAKDDGNRCAAPYVIDVHVREAALVLVRVPESKLLPTMRRNEGIVDVEHLIFARRYRRAELIDHSHSGSRRVRLAGRSLHSRDGW